MYDIIFNALTSEALKKFLKFSGNTEIKLSQNKNDLIKDIDENIKSDAHFKEAFISFYRQIEKAGRKDFWFAELRAPFANSTLNIIRNRINKLEKEGLEIYIPPNEGDTKYFNVSRNDDSIEIKVVRKKIIREQDISKNSFDADYEYVAYKKTPIRHVTYIKFDLSKQHIIMGVDVWRTLNTSEKLRQLEKDMEFIFGDGFWSSIKFSDIKLKAGELLGKYDYIITRELKQQVTSKANQGAVFNIDTGRVATIRKELNDGSIKLNNIKDKYIEDDVRDNAIFKVAASNNIERTTKGGSAILFYYSDITELHEYIKFDVFAAESRIKFTHDNTTLEELDNVFSKIN
ncbi:hypothetical protein [Pedobacter sp. Leaf250]|uniref:hypothetical protein n=1 Tax=Pedobacter sp. Leaf250 TaxID=2876559 RepID=UPI001E4E3AB0|nr:hypothetical protein [Pedobacter sp. Leaf250]